MTTTHRKTTHGRHTTKAVASGRHGRRKVAKRAPPGPSDPSKPAAAHYVPINKDPRHGAEFEYSWTAGGCFNPECTQRRITILSPSNWEGNHLVTVRIPEIAVLRAIKLHRAVAPQFTAFFKAAVAKGLAGKVLTYDGSFVARTLTAKPSVRSNHAFGSAIDINAKWNGWGQPQAPRGSHGSVAELADFCVDFGLYWGGWYSGRKDAMHFEAVKVLEAAELNAACTKHGVNMSGLPSTSAPPTTLPTPSHQSAPLPPRRPF